MYGSCPRCSAALSRVDDAPPAFCPACGLRQLRISGDTAKPTAADGEAANAADSTSETLHLPRALRVVAVAGLLGVVPASLLPGALVAGALGGLLLLLTPMLALGAVFVYSHSRPPARVSPTGGARLGALLGLWMAALQATLTGVAGFILRYGYHSHALDDRITQAAAQVPVQLQAAGPPAPELLQLLQTPEFRAGSFIFGHVLSLLLLVAAGALCGWMAATVLRARRQRTIN